MVLMLNRETVAQTRFYVYHVQNLPGNEPLTAPAAQGN